MNVLIVIVCYKVIDLTIDCLKSLEPEVRSLPGVRVGLCENGTGGNTQERLRFAIEQHGWSPWVNLTAIHPNRGFTGGNNHVIRQALASQNPPDYVILLNADTIIQPGAIRHLVEFMEAHPKAGIAGSQLISPQGVVQASPFRFMGVASEFDRGLRLGIVSKMLSRWGIVPPTPTGNCPAEWVSGCSMIIRRSTLESTGLLDEGLYTYYDDIDYCWNAKKHGWESWYVPASRVIHLEGASTGITSRAIKRRPAYWFQARRRFLLRNYGAFYTAFCDAAFITGFTLWRLRRIIQRKPDTDPPHMLRDAIRHSVFVTGFRVKEVENPALTAPTVTPLATA